MYVTGTLSVRLFSCNITPLTMLSVGFTVEWESLAGRQAAWQIHHSFQAFSK